MSEDRAMYDAERVLRHKLSQFAGIIRHILASENLSPQGQRALELIAKKCVWEDMGHGIYDENFEESGLATHLHVWEKRGFDSECEFIKIEDGVYSSRYTIVVDAFTEDEWV